MVVHPRDLRLRALRLIPAPKLSACAGQATCLPRAHFCPVAKSLPASRVYASRCIDGLHGPAANRDLGFVAGAEEGAPCIEPIGDSRGEC